VEEENERNSLSVLYRSVTLMAGEMNTSADSRTVEIRCLTQAMQASFKVTSNGKYRDAFLMNALAQRATQLDGS